MHDCPDWPCETEAVRDLRTLIALETLLVVIGRLDSKAQPMNVVSQEDMLKALGPMPEETDGRSRRNKSDRKRDRGSRWSR